MESLLLALQKTACPSQLCYLNGGRMKSPPKFTGISTRMIILTRKTCLFLLVFCFVSCFSVEFVPEAGQKEETLVSHKKTWEQIEILKHSPKKKNYAIFGRMIVRNFGEGKIEKFYYDQIKKELFEKGMDGMYVVNTGTVAIPPTIFQAGSAEGYSSNIAEISKDARVIEGIAFRYRERDTD